MKNITAWNILEEFILDSDFVRKNNGAPSRRNVISVIYLVLVKPQLIRSIKRCTTLTHERVRSDHIPLLLDIDDGTNRLQKNKRSLF